MSIENLINYGVKSINDSTPCPDQNTLVVIGVARGGTSMLAGVLSHLGIPMHAARAPVYEDLNLANAFEGNSDSTPDEIIEQYNHIDQWAWKRPLAIEYLDLLEQHLRNPRFIFVFRDIFAIANRSAISMDSETLPLMSQALQQYSKAVTFLGATSSPCLICSSEKMLRYPNELVQAIAAFSGLTPDTATLESAVGSINPEPARYLKASRVNRTHGQIGLVTGTTVKGWAAWWSRDEAAMVEIYLDDKLYTTVRADEQRPHLARMKNTRNGFCGFSAELPADRLKPGTQLRAKIKTDITDLEFSPWEIRTAA